MLEQAVRLQSEQDEAYQNYIDLHHDSTGIICISQIKDGEWKNRYGRYKAMKDYMTGLKSQEDIFFSQNTFKKFRRSTEHLFELKALYIDLDYHQKTNYTRDQIMGNLQILVEDGKIPMPTHVIDSGHGLNLIWRIKRLPAQALPLWRTIEQYLFEQFKDFGADAKALDVTRVFRATSTYNAKYPQKNKVSIINSRPLEYDIHLIQEYVQFNLKPKPTRQRQTRTIVRLYNRYSLYYSRYQDILAICKLRNYEMTGYRETTLFLYRYYGCIYLADTEVAYENALELNSRFTKPLSEAEVRRATRSAERAAKTLKYGYRNQTLVNLLAITDEEMAATNSAGDYYLKSIITKEEKYRRNNQRRYHKRRNEQGNTIKQQHKLDRKEEIALMMQAGLKQKEIAERLGTNIRTVQRYAKLIREEQELVSN